MPTNIDPENIQWEDEQTQPIVPREQNVQWQEQPIELQQPSQPLNLTQRLAQSARPYLQAGGATAGGIIGAGSGLLTGPGAVAASPAGALVGGGLGFAIGDEIADLLENWAGTREPQPIVTELTQAGKNIVEGAAYEAGGQAIGPALKIAGGAAMKVPAIEYSVMAGKELAGKAPAMTKEAVEKLAGKFLKASTSKGPIIAKNIEEARALEEAIPGLKFSYGEMTGDPSLIKLERSAAREPGQFAQELIEQQQNNDRAIRDFLKSKRAEGEIEDTLKAFGATSEELAKKEQVARSGLEAETQKLGMGTGQLEAGQTIRAEAEAAKASAKKEGKKLYREIPQYDWKTINASKLGDEADALTRPMNKLEDVQENVPWKQINRLKEVLAEEGNIVSLKDLDGFQSEIKAEIRKLKSGTGEINERKISRLTQLNSKIENLIEKASTAETPAAQQLKKARTFWKKEVIDKFKKGDVGEILSSKGGGEYRVKDSQIASKFFKPGPAGKESAQQFKNAIGGSAKAMAAIEDAAKQDLLSKFPQGEITEAGLRRWLNQNKHVLKELNLISKFDDITKARAQLNDAISFQNEFNRSEASKLLGSDVQNAIVNALNKGSKGKAAANLMKQTAGNKKAQAGLRNALSDYILEQAQNPTTGMITRLDKLDSLLKKYKPAMNVFYAEDKEALKAWQKARDAFRVASKGRKSPLGSGSDTAENVLTSAFKALGVSSGRIGSLVKAFIDPLKKQEMNKVNALVNQALLNPDYAYTLMLAADAAQPGLIKGTLPKFHLSGRNKMIKEGVLPDYLKRRISQHIATIAGATNRPLQQQEPAQ
ncbi:MAG: hypothetical protein ACWGNO_00035 [Desulfobacterales bacterium]